MKLMTLYNHELVYTGTWENEGHAVTFTPIKNNSITISESIHIPFKGVNSFSRTVPLEEGIKKQDQLIKWQYRKIS